MVFRDLLGALKVPLLCRRSRDFQQLVLGCLRGSQNGLLNSFVAEVYDDCLGLVLLMLVGRLSISLEIG